MSETLSMPVCPFLHSHAQSNGATTNGGFWGGEFESTSLTAHVVSTLPHTARRRPQALMRGFPVLPERLDCQS